MLNPDLFVGTVAIILGMLAITIAIFNWDWYYQLRKTRWVESRLGRGGTRIVFGLLGLGLVVLGIAISSRAGG